ncbi:hypothetical protein [Paenibacillus oleatilyticus]|uniref:hypothetical protein n=1 Tax=Paenibacillus oleatilyticus TaxID=2594886 RepID=UPI001C1F3AC9|nr:hypothetical protein [Paenibacillus oleatilyticus]MBU7316067.1 hypothetical protein [Paenibacillus oleatilyticus]
MIILNLTSILASIGGVGVIGLTIWAAIKFLSKTYVDNYFKKELEEHKNELQQMLEVKKHELQQISELNKFDLQRKMQDFNLFTPKKHSVYAELYGLFLKAEKVPRGLMGFRQVPDYLKFNSSELEYSLKNMGVPDIQIQKFSIGWDQSKYTLIDDLRSYVHFFEILQAKLAFQEARDKFHESKLYLSEKISGICDELIITIWHYIIDIEYIFDKDSNGPERAAHRRLYQEKEERMTELMDELLKEMKEEISVGYYGNG